jgi:hypothetical protein
MLDDLACLQAEDVDDGKTGIATPHLSHALADDPCGKSTARDTSFARRDRAQLATSPDPRSQRRFVACTVRHLDDIAAAGLNESDRRTALRNGTAGIRYACGG